MIRKFLYIIATLCVISSVAFSADASSGSTGDLSGLLTSNDYQANSYGVCRKVKSGYAAKVMGYDFINGITFCSIVPDNAEKSGIPIPKTVNANTLFYSGSWVAKQKSLTGTEAELKLERAKSNLAEIFGFKNESNVIESVEDKDGMTLSAYLASLAVLKDVSADETKGKVVTRFDFKTGESTSETTGQMAQGFNQSNIDYFNNLYTNMNEVYIHLQNLLFVVVGGFFLATLGGGKIQKYLENRGQSTGNKEPYLHKFFIPLLCAGVFYMPITSGKFCIII